MIDVLTYCVRRGEVLARSYQVNSTHMCMRLLYKVCDIVGVLCVGYCLRSSEFPTGNKVSNSGGHLTYDGSTRARLLRTEMNMILSYIESNSYWRAQRKGYLHSPNLRTTPLPRGSVSKSSLNRVPHLEGSRHVRLTPGVASRRPSIKDCTCPACRLRVSNYQRNGR